MGNYPWEENDEVGLVRAAQDGSLPAFDSLVKRYRPAAMIAAREVTKNQEQAEDAVQDSFLAAFKALPHLRDPVSFSAWFGAIVRRRAACLAMGQARHHVLLDDVILAHAPSIAVELETKERDKAVRCAVKTMGEELRPIAELYYLHEWSVRQIGEFLGLPNTTVKWRLHAGRQTLRKSLSNALEETYGSSK